MREMQAKPNGKYETKTKKIRFLLASHQFIFVPESIAGVKTINERIKLKRVVMKNH